MTLLILLSAPTVAAAGIVCLIYALGLCAGKRREL